MGRAAESVSPPREKAAGGAGESSGWSATSGRQEDWGCARVGRVCGGVAAPGSLLVRGHTRVLLKLLPGSCGLLLCVRCFPNEEDLSS